MENLPSKPLAGEAARFYPGIFSCPIVFRTVFDLFHRSANNPNQVARKLEATVLHSFAVSNRRGTFVYKDETGSIFYMSLEALGSGLDADGKVQLLVHGIEKPGPSVTRQLRMLLVRRLLLIAVDMLSSVLAKNPHFNWKRADIHFLRTFEEEWKSLEDEPSKDETPQDYFYEFPFTVYDPALVLYIFRQNICGSTFFHRLHESANPAQLPNSTENHSDNRSDPDGLDMNFNNNEFTLYYNNAPSKLDPSFQGVSTLTEKGAEYSRQVGTGIAIIELALYEADGTQVSGIRLGRRPEEQDGVISVPVSDMRFTRRTDLSSVVGSPQGSYSVRVRIIDTALKRGYLHDWIELTLNQALIGWYIERLLEKSKLGLLRSIHLDELLAPGAKPYSTEAQRLAVVHKYAPGLPQLVNVLDSSHSLPHPAVGRVLCEGVTRSSSVATATLKFLESSIIVPMLAECKPSTTIEVAMKNLNIVRLSRSEEPRSVKLRWDKCNKSAIVLDVTNGSEFEHPIQDSPIDCPEYLCYYSLCSYGQVDDLSVSHPKTYKDIVIDDTEKDKASPGAGLKEFKANNKETFSRSFAFIFSVKRNRRIFWAYNWSPSAFKLVSNRIREADRGALEYARRATDSLQSRSLQLLSPKPYYAYKAGPKENQAENNSREDTSLPTKKGTQTSGKEQDSSTENSPPPSSPGPRRRIRRPVAIRQPKLVGKSVEGAAMQAVAASRARASTNRFKNVGTSTPSKKSAPSPVQESAGAAKRQQSTISEPSSSARTQKNSNQSSKKYHQNQKSNKEESMTSIVAESFFRLISSERQKARRLSSSVYTALVCFTKALWSSGEFQTIPKSITDFVVPKSHSSWSDVCPEPPLPRRMEGMFVLSFSRWIAAWTHGLDIVQLPPTTLSSGFPQSVLLASEVKNVKFCKCFAVIEISRRARARNGRASSLVYCKGRVLKLPRRSKIDQLKKPDGNVSEVFLSERDCVGLDKLSFDLHVSLSWSLSG